MFKELVVKNWKTTVFGASSLILFALTSFGVLTPDQKKGLNEGLSTIVNSVDGNSIMTTISSIAAVLGSVLLLFVKDPKIKK